MLKERDKDGRLYKRKYASPCVGCKYVCYKLGQVRCGNLTRAWENPNCFKAEEV